MADSLRLPVEGMSCGGCVASVTRALQATPGVTEVVTVSLEGRYAEVVLDPASGSADAARQAIEKAGFESPVSG